MIVHSGSWITPLDPDPGSDTPLGPASDASGNVSGIPRSTRRPPPASGRGLLFRSGVRWRARAAPRASRRTRPRRRRSSPARRGPTDVRRRWSPPPARRTSWRRRCSTRSASAEIWSAVSSGEGSRYAGSAATGSASSAVISVRSRSRRSTWTAYVASRASRIGEVGSADARPPRAASTKTAACSAASVRWRASTGSVVMTAARDSAASGCRHRPRRARARGRRSGR